ncbi:MAG: peptide chain release factor N(5)-glutamine methyltransferase [Alphaproteobacteria bacterium]|nr:peptide chain release factor N(5)-glutamine methyltransferase [Alphaproteobacteria bacterium]
MKINQAFTILQQAGGIRAARIITENVKNLPALKVWIMARKLRRGVPVAKIIGQKWFYGLKFFTNKHTLDPRPDTETLVYAVIADCTNNNPRNILDLGTGTGCIICSLIKNIPNSCGLAIDISSSALRVARKNIKALGLCDKIQTIRGSFNNQKLTKQKFDIIVSNPPYIAHNDNRVNDGAMHDPKLALYADKNGLAAYEAIATNAKDWLNNNGKLYLEIGINQGKDIQNIFKKNNWNFVCSHNDLSGIERVLVFDLVAK